MKHLGNIIRKSPLRITSDPYLNMGERLLPFSDDFIQACNTFDYQDVKFYPFKLSKLIKALGTDIIGPGSEYIIQKIIQHVDSNNILFLDPTWPMYEIYCQINNKKYTKIKIKSFYDNPVNDLIINSSKNDLIIINNPNSPFGHYLNQDKLDDFLYLAKNRYVLIDQAYLEFVDNDFDYNYFLNKYENLYFTRTFSKAYGLAGIRVGYCYTNNNLFKNCFDAFPISNNSIHIALHAIKKLNIKLYIDKINKQKEEIYNLVDNYIPSNLHFFHVKDNDFRFKKLSKNIKYTIYNFDNNQWCLLPILTSELIQKYETIRKNAT